jgi:hypothetical protein
MACDTGDAGDDITQKTSALWEGNIYPFVPAYYGDGDTTSWSTAQNGLQIGNIVINGPNSGPPPIGGFDQTVYDHALAFSSNPNTVAIGYVNNTYGRNYVDLMNDINIWASNYPLDGIFFDVSGRCQNPPEPGCTGGPATDQDLARDEWLLQRVLSLSQFRARKEWVTIAFNWGTPYPHMGAHYVSCLEWAMSSIQPQVGAALQIGVRETDEAHYMSASEDLSWTGMNSDHWEWVRQFYPGAFFHLIHDYHGVHTLQEIAQKAADRNAVQVFTTDQPHPTEWNQAPPSGILNPQGAGIPVTWGDWGPEPQPSNCPQPDICAAGMPGC